MCRLFFSLTKNYRNNEAKRLLLNFFDKCEQEDINDGFGICWYKDNQWHAYKKPLHYREDPHIFRKVDAISSKVIIAHARNINKESVSRYHITKEKCIENTHPILYNNHLFMHHGDLLLETDEGLLGHQRFRRLPEFKYKIKELRSQIDTELIKDMQGDTDSEILLFLFLSIQKKIEQKEPDMTREKIMLKSFLEMIKVVEKSGLVNRSNVILAVNGYVIIAKILNNPSRFKRITELNLFVDSKNKEEIVVSTMKLTPESENLKKNTVLLINHKKNIYHSYKI
jgi:predicted glutamine amidotransferase